MENPDLKTRILLVMGIKVFPVTIYHNPKCGTSRNTLAMIRAAGYEPTIVEYLQAGWDTAQLKQIMKISGMTVRDILRAKGTPAEELGLTKDDVADDAILEAMVAHPILVNRPIVVTPKGAKLCRPSEEVFSLLEKIPDSFVKEDGEIIKT